MKNILLTIGAFLLFSNAFAQQVQIQDAQPNWAAMMSNLNTSQISSGVLYNKVGMFTNLLDYNRGKYNFSHADHFMQAINELHYAADQIKFMSAKQLKTMVSTADSTVDIGIINTTMHQLNFNEKNPSTGGLTFANNKFVPILGRPAFLSRKILLISPLREMASGQTVSYQFANNLIFNNATTAIKNLVVYFNDDIPVSIINNSSIIVPTKIVGYTTSGIKVLKFMATFTDNTTINTVGYHYFAYKPAINMPMAMASAIPCTDNLKDRGIYKSTLDFQGYDESVGYYGKFDYTVFYHQKNPDGSINTNQKKMIKPIIIIDGFDPGDKRRTTDCDCEQDTSEGGCFQKYSKDNSGVFNAAEHESIEDLMEYNPLCII